MDSAPVGMQGTHSSRGPDGPLTSSVSKGGDASHPSIPAPGPDGAGRLLAADFAARFGESWKVLWCAAVAIVRDRTQAQDLVQQAAVVGLENLNDFQPGTSFVSWMVRIVKNLALNEARSRARRRTSASDPATLDQSRFARPDHDDRVTAAAIDGTGQVRPGQTEFDDAVMDALKTLDETARACLLMRVVLDLPYRNIALALDIPEGTAASHVHRARAAMRTRLAPEGGDE